MSGRKWTAAELDVLRAEYRRGRSDELAARLGRTWPSVAQKAQQLGLGRRHHKRPAYSPEAVARYRELHARGLTDAEIARAFGTDRPWANALRRRLGLATNKGSAHSRARARGQIARQLAAAGHKTFADYRHAHVRRFACRYGLPEGLPPRAVQIVLALASGPKTKSQICAALGLTWRPGPRGQGRLNAGFFCGRQCSYLSALAAAGLLVRHRLPGSGGKGPSVRGREQNVYALTPHALSLLSQPKESADGSERVE